LPGRGLRGKHAQAIPADHDQVSLAHQGHREAPGRPAFRVDKNAAVHLLVLHVDPLAVQPDLGAVVGRAVKIFGKRPVHVGGNHGTVIGRSRRGPVIVNDVKDFVQIGRSGRPDFDARVTRIGLALADANILERIRAAVGEDLVQHLGQQE
jgi:hypothetical protein